MSARAWKIRKLKRFPRRYVLGLGQQTSFTHFLTAADRRVASLMRTVSRRSYRQRRTNRG
jgi:hypothetical protein